MIEEVIQQLNAKEDMDFLAMKSTLEAIMSGEVDDLLIEAFLIGLNEKGVKEIAVRFSEYEDIALAKYFQNRLKWVWIDTATKLPINKDNIGILSKFKSCIVCPERWGRKQDISKYKKKLAKLKFKPSAIMTSLKHIKEWIKKN
jgi:hypothetical protein